MAFLNLTSDKILRQTTDTVFMVRPVAFAYNTQTSISNAFQEKTNENCVQELALAESNAFIELLKENGIKVVVVDDSKDPHTPDSLFPNNWFSTHEDGTLVLYPMAVENRRLERKEIFLKTIKENFKIKRIVDLTHYENSNLFLEGTGSMVLDRTNKIAFVCKSIRSNEVVLDDFCKQMGYRKIIFNAIDKNGKQIYHTNVMMHIGTKIAVVCLASISNEKEREAIIELLCKTGRTIVDISLQQMNSFAGNMLELTNDRGESCLIMSKTAYSSLTKEQIKIFLKANLKLITPNIKTIEKNGGGSARCMLAEIY